jgi:hypothetical protein
LGEGEIGKLQYHAQRKRRLAIHTSPEFRKEILTITTTLSAASVPIAASPPPALAPYPRLPAEVTTEGVADEDETYL